MRHLKVHPLILDKKDYEWFKHTLDKHSVSKGLSAVQKKN